MSWIDNFLRAEQRYLTPPDPPAPDPVPEDELGSVAEGVIDGIAEDLEERGFVPDIRERETALEVERVLEEAIWQVRIYTRTGREGEPK